MNRKLFYVFGVLLSVFGSCALYKKVIFDESLPLEESSRIVMY
jgi:hypothetical protein